MPLSVTERAGAVATFRFVAVFLMESLARWIPSTPEMEAKVLFGQHVWDMAQLADSLGRRTHELRLPAQHSRAPVPGYRAVLERVAACRSTPDRLAALYDAVLPSLGERFERYLGETDTLMDAPTVRILESAGRDLERLRAEADALRKELSALAEADPGLVEDLRRAEAEAREIVALEAAAEAAP